MQKSFSTPQWVNGANIYEVNIRQYTAEGTFNAFATSLPRLKDMGVKIIWLMPITPISVVKRLGTLGSYYATSDYNKTNPEFGSIDDFKSLVKQAHQLNIKVIIDWVANHTGCDHHWTIDHPEFYKKDAAGNFFDAHGWVDVIDLDYSNEMLRSTMIEAMKFWIDTCDIDGFRCDMAHLVPLDFWETARRELNNTKPNLFWLAETEQLLYNLVFDATYAWELLHTMEKLYRKEVDLLALENVLYKYNTSFEEETLHLAFTSNHDENSHSGSEHERMGEAAKAFAVLTATWTNFLPLVYSGQELPNKKRLLFFDKDHIEWTGNFLLHDFYKSLLGLRDNPAIHLGKTNSQTIKIKTSANDSIFAFLRKHEDDQVLVIINLSSNPPVKFYIEDELIRGNYKSVVSGMEYRFANRENFEMKAWDYLVYVKLHD